MRPISNIRLAIPAVLCASFIYAILSALVKGELSHISVPGILFWRYLIASVLFIPWMLYQTRHTGCDLKPTSFKLYWLRVGCTLASVYLYCAALKNLSIAMTSLLFNTLPLFVPLVARVWKKIPINHQLWWGFGVALLGVGCVLAPGAIVWNQDMLLAVGAGLAGAVSVVSIRFSHYEEPPYRINFYFFVLAFLMTIPMTFWDIDTSWRALSWGDLFPILAIGVTGLLYQELFSFALKNGPARLLAPFMYTAVVWGVILDKWIWKADFTIVMWIGMGLVVMGNILIYLLYPKKDLLT